jgi:glycosyltransferase involved in cell wall biosynthesis
MTPAVSVMMPAYNAARYVAEAVESVLAQTFGDFELLIVDDGSTDRTPAILRRYAARDGRIRLTTRENRGISATRNELLAMARGEFAAVLDADDVALPRRLEAQVAYLRDHPDVVAVGSVYEGVDAGGRYLFDPTVSLDDEAMQEEALAGGCPILQSSAMMRREAAVRVGGYREAMAPAEDVDLWLRLGEVGRLANVPEVLAKYRVHDRSISQAQRERQLACARRAAEEACDRRGIARRPARAEPFRLGSDLASRHDSLLNYGWGALLRGRRWPALRLGLQSVRLMPLRAGGWWLVRAALMPARRGEDT